MLTITRETRDNIAHLLKNTYEEPENHVMSWAYWQMRANEIIDVMGTNSQELEN